MEINILENSYCIINLIIISKLDRPVWTFGTALPDSCQVFHKCKHSMLPLYPDASLGNPQLVILSILALHPVVKV